MVDPLPSTGNAAGPATRTNYLYSDEQIWETNEVGEPLHCCSTSAAAAATSPTPAKPHVSLDILLPNGFLIPLQCPSSRTLAQLKMDVFIQARRLPLFSKLSDISNYIFSTIGVDGVHAELYDEQKPVSSLQSFLPLLNLTEPEGNREEKELAQKIGCAMGIPLSELERHLDREAEAFRLTLFDVCLEAERERGTEAAKHYAFVEEPVIVPPQPTMCGIAICGQEDDNKEVNEKELGYVQIPDSPEEINRRVVEKLKRKIDSSDSYLEIWFRPSEEGEFTHSVRVKDVIERTTSSIVDQALHALRAQHGLKIVDSPADFILQICGRKVFITREVNITQYEVVTAISVISDSTPSSNATRLQYIRSCFENYRIPKLILRRSAGVFVDYRPPPKIFEPSYVRKERHNHYLDGDRSVKLAKNRTLWDLDENLKLRILSATQMSMINEGQLFVKVLACVGQHVLETRQSTSVHPSNPRWQEGAVEFELYLKDLSSCTHLNFLLVSRREKKSRLDEETAVGWAEMKLFDWKGHLAKGKQSLHLLSMPKDLERCTDDSVLSAALLAGGASEVYERVGRVDVQMQEHESGNIDYPAEATIDEFVRIITKRRAKSERTSEALKLTLGSPELGRILALRKCLDGGRLAEGDQHFLWAMRHKIRELFPQMLAVLADCPMIWKERETTCEFYSLLKQWPTLEVDTAIELLDGRHVDGKLRRMAVDHLDRGLNNDQLHLYLLILVQAVRFEPCSASALARMLVKRALMNYRLCHTLFWLLRTECIKRSSASTAASLSPLNVRFALMLEALCRGMSPVHLESLNRQVEMISILTSLSVSVRAAGNKDAATKKLQQELHQRRAQMDDVDSPLNQTDRLGELLIDECRVLGSAKMPLKLTWRNPENLSEITKSTHQLIFKNGDDMRQDLLTLQAMRIMDAKWKSQNLDFCMTIYEVLPMGRNIGLINVVQDCQTLFQIQCEERKGTSFNMDVGLLNKYIYRKCSTDSKQYMECVDRFTSSLAGYCVGTYVLGVKDRHQDNIMLARDGRIFHIDFGHFLGHTKRKLGINRERTDFVLTDHFLYVISRGKQNFRQTYEYTSFRESCITGFMILHHHARFFIVLFRMMLCMGLPELSSQCNIDFLRNSLMYDEPEREAAREAYQKLFENVVKSDWFVSVNWFFHSVKNM